MDSRTQRLVTTAGEIAASGDTIFDALDDFLDGLDTAQRQAEVDRVWLETPIGHAEAQSAYPDVKDQFDILQGDVIRTEAAYILGRARVRPIRRRFGYLRHRRTSEATPWNHPPAPGRPAYDR